MADFNRVTIEPAVTSYGGEFSAYGHGVYERSSVLAGQARRVFLQGGSREDLQTQFPDAEVLEHSTKPMRFGGESLADLSGLPKCAPEWFDPADAGERWDDDY